MASSSAVDLGDRTAQLVADALSKRGVDHLGYTCHLSGRAVVAIPADQQDAATQAIRSVSDGVVGRTATAEGLRDLAVAVEDWSPTWQDRLVVHGADPLASERVGCELQLWTRTEDRVRAPGPTPWGSWFPVEVFSSGEAWPPPVPMDRVTFPIDVVYTWVDDTDPQWRARRDQALHEEGRPPLGRMAHGAFLYRNRDELRYSLRTLERFAPFVRRVHVVTAGQVPSWLDTPNPRVSVVDHEEIFPDPTHLPTFNSHAIEANLHRIEGLSEHFLYCNDDFFFGRPLQPEKFFHANGLARCFPSRAQIPPGPVTDADPGVDVAAKNGRDCLLDAFGRRVAQKFKHAPHALRRSVLAELEERFADRLRATSSHRFRHPDDLSVAASLCHHYGLLTGATVTGGIRYDYVWLDELDRVTDRLKGILENRRLDAFCLNDAEPPEEQRHELDDAVVSFLEQYVPEPSEFERG